MEIWKDVVGYEGLYQVSNKGRVKSRIGIRRTPLSANGYKIVKLCKSGVVKFFLVHRLVANAFLPNPNCLPIINHKDENKLNNSVENLEWCTSEYNVRYSRSKTILQISKNGELVREWSSITEASNVLRIDNSVISKCCNHKRKSCGGFKWEYKKPSEDGFMKQ